MLDHHCALRAAIQRPPASWRRPKGRPRLTWTRVIECNLCPTVPGLHSAWHRSQHRSDWRSLVETAIRSSRGMLLVVMVMMSNRVWSER